MNEAMDPKALEEAMSYMSPIMKANFTALPAGTGIHNYYKRKDGTITSRVGYKPKRPKHIMDPKALEEAMKQREPERKARIIAMPPGATCGSFYKRKDGRVSSRRSRVRPKKEAMDPKALEEAMSNMRPEKKARIIVLTPSSRSGQAQNQPFIGLPIV